MMIRVDEGEDLTRQRDPAASPTARAHGRGRRGPRGYRERQRGGFEAATRSYGVVRVESSRTNVARASRGERDLEKTSSSCNLVKERKIYPKSIGLRVGVSFGLVGGPWVAPIFDPKIFRVIWTCPNGHLGYLGRAQPRFFESARLGCGQPPPILILNEKGTQSARIC